MRARSVVIGVVALAVLGAACDKIEGESANRSVTSRPLITIPTEPTSTELRGAVATSPPATSVTTAAATTSTSVALVTTANSAAPPPAPPPPAVVATVATTTLAVTTTTAAPYDLSASVSCEIGDTLRLGDSGEAVRCLQRRLDEITPAGEVAADGQFGSATDQQVRLFQAAHGLAVDGVVGPQTAESLGIWDPAAATPTTVAVTVRVQQAVAVGGDCNPNYSGCVPNAADVDCRGGSGNGPAYTGRVDVIGADVYGLDGDGDGVGCE